MRKYLQNKYHSEILTVNINIALDNEKVDINFTVHDKFLERNML